jgi:hypothetical protein
MHVPVVQAWDLGSHDLRAPPSRSIVLSINEPVCQLVLGWMELP